MGLSSENHDLRVTFKYGTNGEPIVEIVVGQEARTFTLWEFTNFWLDIIEMARKATTAQMELLGALQHGSAGQVHGREMRIDLTSKEPRVE